MSEWASNLFEARNKHKEYREIQKKDKKTEKDLFREKQIEREIQRVLRKIKVKPTFRATDSFLELSYEGLEFFV